MFELYLPTAGAEGTVFCHLSSKTDMRVVRSRNLHHILGLGLYVLAHAFLLAAATAQYGTVYYEYHGAIDHAVPDALKDVEGMEALYEKLAAVQSGYMRHVLDFDAGTYLLERTLLNRLFLVSGKL